MKFKELYEKDIDRKLNPAVSASDLNDETVNIEIDEYVFTKEIIINLYKILSNIKSNKGSHDGIWINGYYGSGKSHFLKYANYCLSRNYAERAFGRLIEAVENFSKENGDDIELLQEGVELSELRALKSWYMERADVKMVMFNIGDVHNPNEDWKKAVTTIFWNQFNIHRGFNGSNLCLAQYLEKPLADDGKFEDFKEYAKSEGYNWEVDRERLVLTRLDKVLNMAKEVDPELSIDVIRGRLTENWIDVSVDAFVKEMKSWLDGRGDDCRVLFFVDEMSQFIGEHRECLLQLQSMVENLYNECQSKVWIACTAQQKLEEVTKQAGSSNDEIGKILGRFEVRASLQGTEPDFITQRRILSKKGEAEIMLKERYRQDRPKLEAQFVLPTTYRAFDDESDFVNYYPFVPYQFQLFMKVLNSFEELSYVDKQVKGNERSLLNITHSIAKETADWEVGEFVPFDRFFGSILQGSMQHVAQRAIENATKVVNSVGEEEKKQFYRRVVNVLFMVCKLSETDKLTFPATLDNIVTLLMTKIDENKAVMKSKVEEVLKELIDKSVIRKIKGDKGIEIYDFYTEAEREIAELIKNQRVGSDELAEELWEMIKDHFKCNNKVSFATRSFRVQIEVDGRLYLDNNPDVQVRFLTNSTEDIGTMSSLSNDDLIFNLTSLWRGDDNLRRNFLEYCRVNSFVKGGNCNDPERRKALDQFRSSADDMRKTELVPAVNKLLDSSPIFSKQLELELAPSVKGKDRYEKALELHLKNIYTYASLVSSGDIPQKGEDLARAIKRPIEKTLVEPSLSQAEAKVKAYIDAQIHDVTVADVKKRFEERPYGWSEYATIYIVNELVRRNLYEYRYENGGASEAVERDFIAYNLAKEPGKFTIEHARAISQGTLNKFIDAWKKIFNDMSMKGSSDPVELYKRCCEDEGGNLKVTLSRYEQLSIKFAGRPFVTPIDEVVELMKDWLKIRDRRLFFEAITGAEKEAKELFDKCKEIEEFENSYDKYCEVISFVDSNNENFDHIQGSSEAIESIRMAKKDETPWNNLQSYYRTMARLKSELDECREKLVAECKTEYGKAFDELEEYAVSVNVSRDKFAGREETIDKVTGLNGLYALCANMSNIASFKEGEMEKINAAIDAPNVCKREPVTLRTKSSGALKTEADVDLYLGGLKKQIMEHLGENKEVTIN